MIKNLFNDIWNTFEVDMYNLILTKIFIYFWRFVFLINWIFFNLADRLISYFNVKNERLMKRSFDMVLLKFVDSFTIAALVKIY